MRLLLLFIMILFLNACTKDSIQTPNSVVEHNNFIAQSTFEPTEAPESLGGTLINTEQGDFGPFKIGSWWSYTTKIETCNDVPPYECDSTVWTRKINLVKDTIINNKRYLGGSNEWFFMKSGKYYQRKYGYYDYKNGFLEILYLDENKLEGEGWIDTAEIPGFPSDPNAKHVFHHEITYRSDSLIGVTTREELIINGRSTSGGYPTSQLYKRGIGLFDRSEFRDWGTYSFDLNDHHIVR